MVKTARDEGVGFMDIDRQNEELAAERLRVLRRIASQIRSGVTERVVMAEVQDLQAEIEFDSEFVGRGAHAVDLALCLDDWLAARGEGETLSREDQDTIKRLVGRSIQQTARYATIGRNAARAVFQEGQDLEVLVETINQKCPPLRANMRRVLMADSTPTKLKLVSEALDAFHPNMRNAWSGQDLSRAEVALQTYIDILKAFKYSIIDPDGKTV